MLYFYIQICYDDDDDRYLCIHLNNIILLRM